MMRLTRYTRQFGSVGVGLQCRSRTFTSSSSNARLLGTEMYKNGQSQLQFSETQKGVLVAQHDDVHDIDSCRWAIERVRQRLATNYTERVQHHMAEGIRGQSLLMAVKFLYDLEARVEHLMMNGLDTCAVELFERPWVLTCNPHQSRYSLGTRSKTELLRLMPRPDRIAKRIALAALSPVLAPIGMAGTFIKMGAQNSYAACKWYFRVVAELPCRMQLESNYRVVDDDDELAVREPSSALCAARRLVHAQGAIPQLGI